MGKKDSFVLYTDQKAVIDKLSNEQAGKLIKAIYTYIETEKLPKLDMTLDLVITPFITTIDRDKKKYEEISKIRANASKSKQKKQKITNNNKCNDSDNDSDSDSDNDSDNNNNDVVSDSCVDGLQEVVAFYEKNIGMLTPFGLEVLNDYVKDMSSELIIFAMKKAVEANKRTIQYIKGILNNWHKKGIKTLIEAEKEDEEFKRSTQKQAKTETKPQKYTDEEFNKLFANLREEGNNK